MPKRIALLLSCGLLIAACGSSSTNPQSKSASNASNPSGKPLYSQALAFSQCMRAHGVSNFPDPATHGGGISLGFSSGVNPQSPAFQAAQNSCKHLLPFGGPGGGPRSPQARAQLLQVADCMRRHGFADFPDPTTSPPSPGTAGYSVVMGRGGYFLAIPSSINAQSPAFQQAASACNFGPRGGGPGGATTGSGP